MLKHLILVILSLMLLAACGTSPWEERHYHGMRAFIQGLSRISHPEPPMAKNEVQVEGVAKFLVKPLSGGCRTLQQDFYVGDTFCIVEVWEQCPSERSPFKIFTGEVTAKLLMGSDSQTVEDIFSWQFQGHRIEMWSSETCSVSYYAEFDGTADSEMPGSLIYYSENIMLSHPDYGEVYTFEFDPVIKETGIQTGRGFAYKNGDYKIRKAWFTMDVTIYHQQTLADYNDNSVSLGFNASPGPDEPEYRVSLDFTPQDSCYGRVEKTDPSGTLVATFKRDRTGNGEFTVYDSSGKALFTESL